ncbi:MAG TPA: hypothetical protein VGI45_09540 [Terracidiphilus sp.]|jgi:hypothetical protein
MQFLDPVGDLVESRSDGCGRRGRRTLPAWRSVCAGIAFAATFSCVAQDGHPAAASGSTVQGSTATVADPQAGSGVNQTIPPKTEVADGQRKKQISDESTQLLAMAVALKAEVDKTNKDVLSLNVIRRADEIERLARTVKEKIKQGSGPGQ